MNFRPARSPFHGPTIAALTAIAIAVLFSIRASAQTPHITTDGTMGNTVLFNGQNTTIPSTLGMLRGNNLFHSFGKFNIPTAYSATFTDPTASSIANVISRVTGGSISTIDGTLASTIPNSNFYFINPAGVVFGANAKIDVPGSFHVSTASKIIFPDGEFNATNPANTVLSSAPPQAFGFLDDNPAPVRVLGSSLEIPDGETFSIVGGAIQIEGGEEASIATEGGNVILVSVASAGNVAIGADPDTSSFAKLGEITLSSAGEKDGDDDNSDDSGGVDDAPDPNIDVSGAVGGRVIIRGGNLLADNFSIAANTEGDLGGAAIAIDIDISNRFILGGESQFASITEQNGRGGDVVVSAAEVILRDEGEILSDTDGGGQGGRVVITANLVTLSGDAEIASDVDEGASGAGGSVTVNADRIVLGDDSEISSDTSGSGAGGRITLVATSLIEMRDQASIVTDSEDAGDAGDIFIDAGSRFVSRGGLIATSAETADGGNITLKADFLIYLVDSAVTTSVGSGAGNGGNISIDPKFLVMDDSFIQANAFGGNGGNIKIVAGQLLASPNSVIEASSELGIDGDIEIDAPDSDVAGALAVLPANLADAASQLAQQCSARGGRTLASFVGTGRGGLPEQPGGSLSAYYISNDDSIGRPQRSDADRQPRMRSLGGDVWRTNGLGNNVAESRTIPGTLLLSCSG